MKNTRRTFLQALAAIPLMGRAFTQPLATGGVVPPPVPGQLPPVVSPVTFGRPVYGFDENKMLSDLFGQKVFVYGEKVERGDFVAMRGDNIVVKAGIGDRPVGIATVPAHSGEQAQDTVLVQGVYKAGVSAEEAAAHTAAERRLLEQHQLT